MNPAPRQCPECGTPLPQDAPRGACPRCLMLRGFESLAQAAGAGSRPTVHLVLPDQLDGLTEIGDYELLSEIGRGGMGVIYQARQRSLDRLVALKLIRSGALATEEAVARFKLEAAATARLRHPGIVTVYEVGEHDGQHFYSMDFVAGRSLAAALREGPLAPRLAAECVRTVAEAIHYAHDHGVIHRDLKPSNILLDAEGQPHVADFGLAKLLQSDSELTLTGAVLGTPSYMPPEQARGRHADVSARSDVYALGAILYECLTGRPPFTAATPLETMKLVAEQEPVPPRVLNPTLPADLQTICLKCLAKEPAGRYASAQALADELDRFLADEPIHARPTSAAERAWRWCRRKPAIATLAGLSIAAPLAFVALLLAKNAEVRREANRAIAQEALATNSLARAESETRRAETEALRAGTNALTARQNLYAADLFVAAQFVEAGQLGPALRLLEGQRPKPGEADLRGFEWRYLRAQCEGTHTRVLRAHAEPVLTLAYSPDGHRLAAGDAIGVLVWNTQTWELAATVPTTSEWEKGIDSVRAWSAVASRDRDLAASAVKKSFKHDPDVLRANIARATVALAFSPDSHVLATSDEGHFVKFWDATSGRLLASVPEMLARIAFLPNSNVAFIGSDFVPKKANGRAGLYDWAQAKPLLTLSNAGGLLALSGDGQRLVTTKSRGGGVRIWDTASSQEISSFAHDDELRLLAISPDGSVVATCQIKQPGRFTLWETASGRWLGYADGHPLQLTALAFSPDSRTLATASIDAPVRLWDAAKAKERGRLDGHLMGVDCLAYSPDGRTLAAGGRDGTVRLWDLPPAKPKAEQPALEVLPPLVFSGDGQRLAGLDHAGHPTVVDVDAPTLIAFCDRTNLLPLFFSPTGETLTCLAQTNRDASCELQQWDVATRALRSRLMLEESEGVNPHLRASRSQRRVASFFKSQGLLWDTASGRLERDVFLPRHQLDQVELSPDGKYLAIASHESVSPADDHRLTFWDADSGRPLSSSAGQKVLVVSMVFTPDSGTLVTGCHDNLIRLWDASTGALRSTLAGHGGSIDHLAVSTDGRTLASVAADFYVKLWSLATGRELATLSRDHVTRAIAFSPDGHLLCSARGTSALFVWRAP